jgi:hypothetical protein
MMSDMSIAKIPHVAAARASLGAIDLNVIVWMFLRGTA